MNTSLFKNFSEIANPFFMVDLGIEKYSKHCKKISDILYRLGNSQTNFYDTPTERGDTVILISCIIETVSDIAPYKNSNIVLYWDKINRLKPHLSILLNETLADTDLEVKNSITKVKEIFVEE